LFAHFTNEENLNLRGAGEGEGLMVAVLQDVFDEAPLAFH
jgi:hypothetical protein